MYTQSEKQRNFFRLKQIARHVSPEAVPDVSKQLRDSYRSHAISLRHVKELQKILAKKVR